MTELIKIEKMNDGRQAVSAKELYRFLTDKSNKNYSRWAKMNITENAFAIEHVDYEGFFMVKNGNKTVDYALTVDFAKKLAMLSNTKRGDEARDYFLECEKELENQQNKPMTLTEIVASSANILVEHEKQLEKITSRQDMQDKQLKQVNQSVNNISNIVAINGTNWRHDCDRILGKCAYAIDDDRLSYPTNIKAIRADVYTQMRTQYSIDLMRRLTNAKNRMANSGASKTAINKLSKIDIIAKDKKAIMAYVDCCKKMAIKYQITL